MPLNTASCHPTIYTTGNSSFAVCHGHSAKPEKHSAKGLPSVTLSKELTTATVPANSVFAECFLSGTRQKLCRELKTTLGKKKSTSRSGNGHGTFAECQILGTRQSLVVCRVSNFGPSANLSHLSCVKLWTLGKACLFAVCQSMNTRQSWPFCHVKEGTLGKVAPFCRVSKYGHSAKTVPKSTEFGFFAECHRADTRQRCHFSPRMHRILPRVYFAEWFTAGTRQKASFPSVTLGKDATNNQFIWFGDNHDHIQINITDSSQ